MSKTQNCENKNKCEKKTVKETDKTARKNKYKINWQTHKK